MVRALGTIFKNGFRAKNEKNVNSYIYSPQLLQGTIPWEQTKKGLFPGIISRDDPIGAKNHVKYHAQIKL